MFRTIASVVAAVGVILVAAGKVMQGEAPDWQEITLAIAVISAAVGFQRTP